MIVYLETPKESRIRDNKGLNTNRRGLETETWQTGTFKGQKEEEEPERSLRGKS